ncbi:hemerythrin domain-containing protein [Shinella sp.]|uniref:hemerythrin domain-containing protein n=1 Tax=Shinella sp. TaxID=1870904 RepID=UPI00301BBE1B
MTEPSLAAADIGRLEALHKDLLDLCLRLEEAAGEPGIASELRNLADAIPPLLRAVHDLEERLLFPDFDRNAGSCFAALTIERLKAEHRYDRLAAEELSLTLKAVAEERCALSPDTVARMIGGFQESLRRHVFSEQVLLEALLSAKADVREVFA